MESRKTHRFVLLVIIAPLLAGPPALAGEDDTGKKENGAGGKDGEQGKAEKVEAGKVRPAIRLIPLRRLQVVQPAAEMTEEPVPSGEEWKPSHSRVRTFKIADAGGPAALNSFCIDREGRILACCGGSRYAPRPGDSGVAPSAAGAVRVLSPEGKLLAAWPLEFVPQAISRAPDGTFVVGGSGRVARLDGGGKVLRSAEWPPPESPEPVVSPAAPAIAAAGPVGAEEAARKERLSLLEALLGRDSAKEEEAAAKRRDEARRAYEREVTGITATDRDIFVASPSKRGFGVYRIDGDLGSPRRIIDRLGGCCGQMDILARGGELWVAENGRHRIVRHDRDGKVLGSWGQADRQKAEGFGGCCEPKNIRFAPNGDLYTAESGPPEVVKLFGADGKFRKVVALPRFSGGCVRITVDVSPVTGEVFVLETGNAAIHVFAEAPPAGLRPSKVRRI